MTKKGKWTERGKSVLIVLLVISALLLAARSGIFDMFLSDGNSLESVIDRLRGGRGLPLEDDAAETGAGEAARPLFAAVTGSDGKSRYGVKYNAAAMDVFYEDAGTILGEALGSALEPVHVDELEWRSARSGAGL